MTKSEILNAARVFFTDKAQTGEPSPAFLRDVVEFMESLGLVDDEEPSPTYGGLKGLMT